MARTKPEPPCLWLGSRAASGVLQCGVVTNSALALLEAQDSATGDISPSSGFVHITLQSDKFFSGQAALTQAEELRRLAEALHGRGVPAKALALVGASVDVASGVFTKSSSVTYRVRVLLEQAELLGAVLDAVIYHFVKARGLDTPEPIPQPAPALVGD